MSEWYNTDEKRHLTCIMSGCRPCLAKKFCIPHDKPCKDNAPSIPLHCKECGEFIMNEKKDTRGMFG